MMLRYLVYDRKCLDFPWEGGNAKQLLMNNFLSVGELSDVAELEYIPRTCFLFGNQERISNLTIPIIDHMRKILVAVTSNLHLLF